MKPGRRELLVFTDQVHLHFLFDVALWFWNRKCTRSDPLTHLRVWPGVNVDDRLLRDRCCAEVRMQLVRWGADRTSAEVMSDILNCVCPECGGSMGGVGREFKSQGQCRTDWRQIWERIFSAGLNRPTTKATRLT